MRSGPGKPPLYTLRRCPAAAGRSLRPASDWARLIWQAQRYEHILPLRNMLAVLQDRAWRRPARWVVPALHKMAISHAELRQFHQACESAAVAVEVPVPALARARIAAVAGRKLRPVMPAPVGAQGREAATGRWRLAHENPWSWERWRYVRDLFVHMVSLQLQVPP